MRAVLAPSRRHAFPGESGRRSGALGIKGREGLPLYLARTWRRARRVRRLRPLLILLAPLRRSALPPLRLNGSEGVG